MLRGMRHAAQRHGVCVWYIIGCEAVLCSTVSCLPRTCTAHCHLVDACDYPFEVSGAQEAMLNALPGKTNMNTRTSKQANKRLSPAMLGF